MRFLCASGDRMAHGGTTQKACHASDSENISDFWHQVWNTESAAKKSLCALDTGRFKIRFFLSCAGPPKTYGKPSYGKLSQPTL